MALKKSIMQEDGVTTNYHRILYIHNTLNKQCSIAVVSYIDNTARTNEQDMLIAQPYMKAVTYETKYDEGMTPEKAYDYLKTLPQFEGAEDI